MAQLRANGPTPGEPGFPSCYRASPPASEPRGSRPRTRDGSGSAWTTKPQPAGTTGNLWPQAAHIRRGNRWETLTLILHKTKDTKNKVVYGTKDGSVIQSVLY